ncbi:MAG: Imm27 family immunity protein, partial [Pseudomonas sp.]
AAKTLGRAGSEDVFATAAEDIAGMSARQVAKRLEIPRRSSGFNIIEFPASAIQGVASPINRSIPGFVGRGLTTGGAREFVIRNGPIPFEAIDSEGKVRSIGAHETAIIGAWVEQKGELVQDEASERIEELLSSAQLREIARTDDGWNILYRDIGDGRLWELTYPSSAMAGGGPPSLVNISLGEAHSRYRVRL